MLKVKVKLLVKHMYYPSRCLQCLSHFCAAILQAFSQEESSPLLMYFLIIRVNGCYIMQDSTGEPQIHDTKLSFYQK